MRIREVVSDFETASGCDLKRAGAWRYAEDFSTEVLCLVMREIHSGHTVRWMPGMPMPAIVAEWAADPYTIFIAHNAAFEQAIWQRQMVEVHGWPALPPAKWHDSLAVCAMKVIPQALERAVSMLGLTIPKDMEGNRLTLGLSKMDKHGNFPPRPPETMARVLGYCTTDVAAQVQVHQRVGWLPKPERKVWLLDQKINQRGVRLDLEFVSAAQDVVAKATKPLAAEFEKITGYKFTQAEKVKAWVEKRGVYIPDLTKESVAALLGVDEDGETEHAEERWHDQELPEDVHRALSIRQLVGSASVKKLGSMDACVCMDGRARGLLQYHGAGPGRWAGRLIQPQNYPRGTITVDDRAPDPEMVVRLIKSRDVDLIQETLGPAVEVVLSALRYAMLPTEGRLLTVGDFAGVEARLVLAASGQHDKAALMASGADVYCDMASDIFDRPINKKEHPEERQTGKNTVLGCGFGMGARKFQARYAKDKPLSFAERVIQTYRKVWAPNVPKMWYGLEGAAVRAVHDGVPKEAYGVRFELEDGWLTARLPSGRKLWYWNPKATRKAVPWDEFDIRLAYTYTAVKTGKVKTITGWGGLVTENVIQALARDLLVHAMFRCEDEGLEVILTIHDEIVTETDGDRAKLLEQIMMDRPAWAVEMQAPIAAECWSGPRYRKG